MPQADNWGLPIDGIEGGYNYSLIPGGFKLFDVRGALPPEPYSEGTIEKIGYTVHHATGFYDGQTLARDITYIRSISDFHRNAPPVGRGWPGIGYHRMGNPYTGNWYILGSSATVRAHVQDLNHLWIGYCFMGGWEHNDIPALARQSLIAVTQWETNQRKVPMQIRPHKFFQPTNECPGKWAFVDSWNGLLIQPQLTQPTPAPTPVPTPTTVKAQLNAKVLELQQLINRVNN